MEEALKQGNGHINIIFSTDKCCVEQIRRVGTYL